MESTTDPGLKETICVADGLRFIKVPVAHP